MSGASPVTVAGPLRILTAFLGSLKRFHHRAAAPEPSSAPGDRIDTRKKLARREYAAYSRTMKIRVKFSAAALLLAYLLSGPAMAGAQIAANQSLAALGFDISADELFELLAFQRSARLDTQSKIETLWTSSPGRTRAPPWGSGCTTDSRGRRRWYSKTSGPASTLSCRSSSAATRWAPRKPTSSGCCSRRQDTG